MGISIADEKPFMGTIPMRKVRDLLRAWHEGDPDPATVGAKTSVVLDPRTVLAVLAELKENGLIGVENSEKEKRTVLRATEAGKFLMAASAKRRSPKAKARTVLDGLLKRADMVNADPDMTKSVDRIWVFGSMVDPGRETVGDIDFVVERSKRRPYSLQDPWLVERHIRAKFGHIVPDDFDSHFNDIEEKVLWDRLDGGEPQPLLSRNELLALKNLHVPCQLVYDASRGGRVDDPVLPHHPDSSERAAEMRDRPIVPSLSLGAMPSPCDARFLGPGLEPGGLSDVIRRAFGYDDPMRGRDPHLGTGYSMGAIVASPDEARRRLMPAHWQGELPAELQHLDGTNRFAIAFRRPAERAFHPVPGWIIVDRSVHLNEDTWIHQTSVHLHAAEGVEFNAAELEWTRMVVSMLGTADAYRLHARKREFKSAAEIEIHYGVGGDGPSSEYLLRMLHAPRGDEFFSHMPHAIAEDVGLLVHDEPIAWSEKPPHLEPDGHACRLAM